MFLRGLIPNAHYAKVTLILNLFDNPYLQNDPYLALKKV